MSISDANDLIGLALKESQWATLARERDVTSILSIAKLVSASKVHNDQYLALKVRWNFDGQGHPSKTTRLNEKLKISEQTRRKAMTALQDQRSWRRYLVAVELYGGDKPLPRDFHIPPELGLFGPALRRQLQVQEDKSRRSDADDEESTEAARIGPIVVAGGRFLRSQAAKKRNQEDQEDQITPPRGLDTMTRALTINETPNMSIFNHSSAVKGSTYSTNISNDIPQPAPSKDEKIVNVALVDFLDAITLSQSALWLDWHIDGESFVFRLPDMKSFKAVTDGSLKGRVTGRTWAILECKARRRYRDRWIRMQESCQMASWIRQHFEASKEPTGLTNKATYARVLIAQDREEIYIVVAEFEKEYRDYLLGISKTDFDDPKDFLLMSEYGPYRTDRKDEMEELGYLIYAFALLLNTMECNSPQSWKYSTDQDGL
ncbi:hypothetical protein MMC25_007990 [Agyrium rufum]|nr:hypothetical protein [Agyrium rufum]